MGGGRELDDVWRCYTRKFRAQAGTGGRYFGVCTGCQRETSGVTYRLRRHASCCESLHALGLWEPPRQAQRTLVGMLHGHGQQDAFEQQLARVVYSGNLPFRAVDDLQMVKFLKQISPGMQIPSRKNLAGRLLDEEHCRQVKHLVAILRHHHLTISIDG